MCKEPLKKTPNIPEMRRYQKSAITKALAIYGIFGVFSSGFLAQNYSNVNTESILSCFREFKFLAQIEYFAKAIAHAKAISPLRDGRFSTSSQLWNIWCFFERFFSQNYSKVNAKSILTWFRQFKFVAQIE